MNHTRIWFLEVHTVLYFSRITKYNNNEKDDFFSCQFIMFHRYVVTSQQKMSCFSVFASFLLCRLVLYFYACAQLKILKFRILCIYNKSSAYVVSFCMAANKNINYVILFFFSWNSLYRRKFVLQIKLFHGILFIVCLSEGISMLSHHN